MLTWLPYEIVFDVTDAHSPGDDTFKCSDVDVILTYGPDCLDACLEDKTCRGFYVLRLCGRRFLTMRNKVIGEIVVKGEDKYIYLFNTMGDFIGHKKFMLILDLFPEFFIKWI